MRAARRKEVTSISISGDSLDLEQNLHLDLALAVVDLRSSTGVLGEGSVARVLIRAVEPRAIEGVEVVHLQDGLEPLTHVEVLSGVQVFHQVSRISEVSVDPLRVADDVLRRGCGKACRIEHRWSGSRAACRKVITHFAVGSGGELD